MTQLTTLRAARWGEGAVPALPRSLRLLKLGEDIELGLGGGGAGGEAMQVPDERDEGVQGPRLAFSAYYCTAWGQGQGPPGTPAFA